MQITIHVPLKAFIVTMFCLDVPMDALSLAPLERGSNASC